MSLTNVQEGHHQSVDEENLSDDGSHMMLGEKKKKRLQLEQVKALEKSFELGNKLEPERKMQLAKALGMQPRQIAIWFQNRRARWKTRQLERDYDSRNSLSLLNPTMILFLPHNKKVLAEVMSLKNNDCNEASIIRREGEASWSNNGSIENSSDINLEMPGETTTTHVSTIKDLFPSAIRASTHHHQNNEMVQEQSFCNMFNDIDETTNGYWAWSDPNHNNHHQFN
ncbi:hypothetical protein Bca4012_069415 [Brassica carinata]